MKRPFAVTFLGGLFIIVGLASLLYHLLGNPIDRWTFIVGLVSVLAIVGGVFLIKGRAWARWLVLVWLAVHVVVSAFHSLSDSMAHLLLLITVSYFLLGPPASGYFRAEPSE